jgi:hypothetical protein
VGRASGSRGGDQGPARASLSTAADHAHDFDVVALLQRDPGKGGSLEDRSVVLDRDRALVHTKLIEIVGEASRMLQLNLLSVDLQRDHSKSLIAA